MEERTIVRASVRQVVEFILRSGDLDSSRGGLAEREAMQAGTRMHQNIQKKMGAGYQAEVPLACELSYEHFILRLEGRADGVITDPEGVIIDEIKGRYQALETLAEPVPVHLAQAKCYAHMYCQREALPSIRVLMTYCLLEPEERRSRALTKEDVAVSANNRRIRHFLYSYDREELEDWFHEVMDAYALWIEQQIQWRKRRDDSMTGLEFPFPYREGQRELVAGVYRTILRGRELFVQAPTGVGKTMSVVFPAVRAIGEGHGEMLFYLTAKTITRTVAEEAFAILRERGLRFRTVTLTAKEKVCVLGEAECSPAVCPRARGHFDRVNDAVFEMLSREEVFDREALLSQAERWQVCPHEFQLDVATWMDGVICDYNYAFDPNVRLKRFFGEGGRGGFLFLIDEAHNLVERGREMFSASLVKEDVLEVRRLLRPFGAPKELDRALSRCNRQLLLYKRECGEEGTELESVAPLLPLLQNLSGELERYLEEHREGVAGRQVLDFYFQVRSFLAVSELVDDHYLIYGNHREDGNFQVRLFCVNPAANLQACIDRGRSAVFFSATLLPIRYYRTMFSTHTDDYAVYVDSPFDPARRRLLVNREVSTVYRRRGREEYERIAACIDQTVRGRRGNYLVFFPSYRLMGDVYAVYEELYGRPEVSCLVQTSSMGEQEREEFLGAFSAEHGKTLVGFVIMGGIFSEGIDLDGEKLIGAVVVGTGIPQVGWERELLRRYFDRHGEDGFAYAYRYPGMNKVLQAAGRVIRTAKDAGVILLLDERFGTWEYRQLFPREWSDCRVCRTEALAGEIRAFWEEIGADAKERR